MSSMLNEERTQFQKEQDQLLKTVLNLRYFNPWSFDEHDQFSLANDANLEIYITNVCNLKCSYCYLQQFPDLYPSDKRDPALLLHNLRLLYDWIMKENFHIPKVEFFTGEIWHTQFGRDVLQITYEYLQKGMKIDWFMIASNCTFVRQDETLQPIQHYIDLYKQIGHPIQFSISTDGKIVDNANRPPNDKNTLYNDDFYDSLFSFAKHNGYLFHPMFAAPTMKYWIENLKWWHEQFAKYDLSPWTLMTLEVRNDDWTDEYIQDYLNVVDYYMKLYLKTQCGNDYIRFAQKNFDVNDYTPGEKLTGYVNWGFPETDTFMGCTVATDLTVRLGDLALCPCHRTAYNKYLYGYFTVENDEIVDITANNPQMAIKVLMDNINLSNFGCDQCLYNDYCLKGCCGSQVENMGDPWIPIPSVCKLFKARHSFLLKRYEEWGIIDYLKTIDEVNIKYTPIHHFIEFYNAWKQKEGK